MAPEKGGQMAPKNPITAVLGAPVFVKPERPVRSKDGKSSLAVRVSFPIIGSILMVETGIWGRTYETDDATVTEYSVSLPRNAISLIDRSEASLDAYEEWRTEVMAAFDVWEAKHPTQASASTGKPSAGVRVVKKVQTAPQK